MRAIVAICGYRVRRGGCLDRALRLAFGLRIVVLLILHTREIGLRCRHAPQPSQPRLTAEGAPRLFGLLYSIQRLQPLIIVCTLLHPSIGFEMMLRFRCHVERRVWEAVVAPRYHAGCVTAAWELASQLGRSSPVSSGGARQ
jgi:hypothetical protein